MVEQERESRDGQLLTTEAELLVRDDLTDFAENERASYALIINNTLSDTDPESPMSKRLLEAVANYQNESTRKTSNEIRALAWEQFLGCTLQRKYPRQLGVESSARLAVQGPVKKVFDTPELLEAILFNLSMVDLVAAGRTNKMVQTVMETSPLLRPSLFLRPVQPTAVVEVKDPYGFDPIARYTVASLNPLLRLHEFESTSRFERLKRQAPGETVELRNNMSLAGAWNNMYLTNPPCTKVEIYLKYTNLHAGCFGTEEHHCRVTVHHTICRESGVTFAMLMEAAHLTGLASSTPDCDDLSAALFHFGTSAASVVLQYETQYGCKMRLDLERTYVTLVGIILPSESELNKMEPVTDEGYEVDDDEVFVAGVHPGSLEKIKRLKLTA